MKYDDKKKDLFKRRSSPTIKGIICFISDTKHLSHTYAAKKLCITQRAVSRQIQQLENFLGVELFIRTRHGVELTIAGQQYIKSIKPYTLGLEKCTADVISHNGSGGTLKLGVVPTFATHWLLPKLHL
ncbi:LysR family transcriptional regulator, partial [Acinetobacter baumannii]|uniref:LysR family transcriptional regulator n=1 Tax=Acinetobacter baumannii TaxID=470 RepID=UPI001111CDCB